MTFRDQNVAEAGKRRWDPDPCAVRMLLVGSTLSVPSSRVMIRDARSTAGD